MQMEVTQAEADVLNERRAHISREGWTPEHDDEHVNGEIARAAAAYALSAGTLGNSKIHDIIPSVWPWSHEWWKPRTNRADLVRAGSLVIAEIERIDRGVYNRVRAAPLLTRSR